TKSFLDDISGIGSVRKKKLMETFGSMDKISKASLNDLVNIGKLPKNIAEELHTKFAESRT
ncbi:MAG: excinuclease ABC subunit C, partial [Candidatus Sericytochromatia bacterium]|nr:excinuclease ABC subunit C [Candidatus Sericytochromatia bacterium]